MEIKEQAIQNLKDIKQILDDLKITFWLDGGTCLGAYRDKDFCKDDENDIDLCCWDNHLYLVDEIIKRALEKGFIVHHKWELEIALIKNKSKIDLFFNRKNKQEAYTHLYDGDIITKYVVIPVEFYEKLEEIEFYGDKYLIPSPIEEYLTLKYGDWKTPIHRSQYSCINPKQNKIIRDTYEI
jgi:phosphorylcholine metabolism protein LicD